MGDARETILLLKYDRIPKFCFCCGLLGHPLRDCINHNGTASSECTKNLRFGSWLRARSPPRNSSRNSKPDSNSSGRDSHNSSGSGQPVGDQQNPNSCRTPVRGPQFDTKVQGKDKAGCGVETHIDNAEKGYEGIGLDNAVEKGPAPDIPNMVNSPLKTSIFLVLLLLSRGRALNRAILMVVWWVCHWRRILL
ncbi:hypothetical protein ACOSQ2_002739 [Xanthoceras sorbifolium]